MYTLSNDQAYTGFVKPNPLPQLRVNQYNPSEVFRASFPIIGTAVSLLLIAALAIVI